MVVEAAMMVLASRKVVDGRHEKSDDRHEKSSRKVVEKAEHGRSGEDGGAEDEGAESRAWCRWS